MNILEAYDLTGSFRDAGELAGCSHHTVARYVRAREEGRLVPGASAPRPGVIDGFLPKLEELVERSKGRVRADVAHEKITAMGYAGIGAHDAAGGRAAEEGLALRTAAGVPPVGPGAGDVGAVRLRGRPGGRRGGDGAVLPVAGLVAGSGSCSRSWTRPRRRSGPPSTSRCAGPAGSRPTC